MPGIPSDASLAAAAAPPDHVTALLAVTLVVYVVVMFAIGLRVQGRIHDAEDFLVAGRRLPLGLAWATLLATWFGAGTLLIVTDEVRAGGLVQAALDPFGAGVCLLIAGLFFAGPLWRMKLLTLSDFFRRRFGQRAELLSAFLMVPGYFGWIAAQFVALAGLLDLFFGIPPALGIALSAAVGMGYTLIGGMWSVTLTDAVQISLVLLGLVVLSWVAFAELGAGSPGTGLARLLSETPREHLRLLPDEDLRAFVGWLGVFTVGALGNIPGQDLMQRVFASRSARVARAACLVAGVVYLVAGVLPLALGLAANLMLPGSAQQSTLPLLASVFLNPFVAIVLVVAVLSAVLSTVDSAILSPASVLAQNLLPHAPGLRLSPLVASRVSVVFVTVASLVVAYLGESAYSLLESAYELPLVALFVPLTLGLWGGRGSERAALAAMATGSLVWLLHIGLGWNDFAAPLGWPVPVAVASAGCAALAYGLACLGGRAG